MKIINSFFVVILLFFSCGESRHDEELTDCDIHNNICIKSTQNKEIHFNITPKPVKVMKPLTFTIKLINDKEEHEYIVIDLSMTEMYMGFNQIVLNRKDSGYYEGTGMIPTCPQGKTLWKVKVIIKDEIVAEFLFNVQK